MRSAPILTVGGPSFASLFAKDGQHSDFTMGFSTQQCEFEITSTEQPP
jgi:hypothetical protein